MWWPSPKQWTEPSREHTLCHCSAAPRETTGTRPGGRRQRECELLHKGCRSTNLITRITDKQGASFRRVLIIFKQTVNLKGWFFQSRSGSPCQTEEEETKLLQQREGSLKRKSQMTHHQQDARQRPEQLSKHLPNV